LRYFFIVTLSLATSLAWVIYLYNIDAFEKEKIKNIVFVFLIGTIFPFIIYPIHDFVFKPLQIYQGEGYLSSFLYNFLAVGLLEECIKLVPTLFALYALKNSISEPFDFIKYSGISALGFAFGENIEYALNYGTQVLVSRSILSVPAHMFFACLTCYGFILAKYRKKGVGYIFIFIILGALAHGLFDFILETNWFALSMILCVLLFCFCLEAFVEMTNNTLNVSPHYNPKIVIDQVVVRKQLLLFYFPIIITTIIVATLYDDAESALGAYIYLMVWQSSLIVLMFYRMSRFSIIENYWKPIHPSLPFTLKKKIGSNDVNIFFGLLTIKGEGYNSARLASLYDEDIIVKGLHKSSLLSKTYKARIIKKSYLSTEAIYILSMTDETFPIKNKSFIVRAKTNGISHTMNNNPIVSLNSLSPEQKLVFHEWVILIKSENKEND
jgi:RsiW-degrading membrane proteinase PrsW (M82 family)